MNYQHKHRELGKGEVAQNVCSANKMKCSLVRFVIKMGLVQKRSFSGNTRDLSATSDRSRV